jgi:hypothetical protein
MSSRCALRRAWAQLRAGMNHAAPRSWSRRRPRAEREAERIFEVSPALLAVAGFDGYLSLFNPAFEVVEWTTRVVPEEGFLCAAGRDVTESRRDVTESRRAAEEQAALRRVATLVAKQTPHAEVFALIAEEIGDCWPSIRSRRSATRTTGSQPWWPAEVRLRRRFRSGRVYRW